MNVTKNNAGKSEPWKTPDIFFIREIKIITLTNCPHWDK